MEPDPTDSIVCHTCGYTGDTRRFYLYESWCNGTLAACENCLRLYEMTQEANTQLIPAEETR